MATVELEGDDKVVIQRVNLATVAKPVQVRRCSQCVWCARGGRARAVVLCVIRGGTHACMCVWWRVRLYVVHLHTHVHTQYVHGEEHFKSGKRTLHEWKENNHTVPTETNTSGACMNACMHAVLHPGAACAPPASAAAVLSLKHPCRT